MKAIPIIGFQGGSRRELNAFLYKGFAEMKELGPIIWKMNSMAGRMPPNVAFAFCFVSADSEMKKRMPFRVWTYMRRAFQHAYETNQRIHEVTQQ